MQRWWLSMAVSLAISSVTAAAESPLAVSDDASLREAINRAEPGTRITIAPGQYTRSVHAVGLAGTEANPIVIEGADADDPPVFVGNNVAWHLIGCTHVTVRNLTLQGQRDNGIQADDGGNPQTPSHHILIEGLRVSETGPEGNHDAIKLSGLDDFVVRDCTTEGWGGQAIDLVGCHHGLIEGCTFRAKDGFSQRTGPQIKGGSSDIVVRRCLFLNAAERGVNLGGSTGFEFFRPKGALFEAKDLTVEGCTFVGCESPIAFVGVDGATVRYNTFYRPAKWVARILQETTADGFVPCRNGRFEHNLIVYRRADVRTFVNVGRNTDPDSFRFANNLWYCEDRPLASRPTLPVEETGGLCGVNPLFAAADENDFRATNPRAAGYGAGAFPASIP